MLQWNPKCKIPAIVLNENLQEAFCNKNYGCWYGYPVICQQGFREGKYSWIFEFDRGCNGNRIALVSLSLHSTSVTCCEHLTIFLDLGNHK